ncbi:hypothetical protein EDEG_00882 [Edhazardia aedis USNM 41457]|uniref:Uncharacterized protein n=1 Tax=Edhazardia aedis (strain USNM 41457) TaxID=1003232 RepID=J9DC09_EDHAE|nr:hypothetical protein EDEG_00882 [Edhazardia aedis USNM 41457]|eukprot:EJW05029.1 hypothetical protein EDEG_00882 [Edhazardia aedis USNM 41457]
MIWILKILKVILKNPILIALISATILGYMGIFVTKLVFQLNAHMNSMNLMNNGAEMHYYPLDVRHKLIAIKHTTNGSEKSYTEKPIIEDKNRHFKILDKYFSNLKLADKDQNVNYAYEEFNKSKNGLNDDFEALQIIKNLIDKKNDLILIKYRIKDLFEMLGKIRDTDEEFKYKGEFHKQIFHSAMAQVFIKSGIKGHNELDFVEENKYFTFFFDHYIRFSKLLVEKEDRHPKKFESKIFCKEDEAKMSSENQSISLTRDGLEENRIFIKKFCQVFELFWAKVFKHFEENESKLTKFNIEQNIFFKLNKDTSIINNSGMLRFRPTATYKIPFGIYRYKVFLFFGAFTDKNSLWLSSYQNELSKYLRANAKNIVSQKNVVVGVKDSNKKNISKFGEKLCNLISIHFRNILSNKPATSTTFDANKLKQSEKINIDTEKLSNYSMEQKNHGNIDDSESLLDIHDIEDVIVVGVQNYGGLNFCVNDRCPNCTANTNVYVGYDNDNEIKIFKELQKQN